MRDSGTQTAVDGDETATKLSDEEAPDEELPADELPADELTDEESGNETEDEAVDTSHLDAVEDGCGCAEVWEHLSDERDN